jgi:hypothetical protein
MEVENQFSHNCDKDSVNLSEITVGDIITTSIHSSKFSFELTQTQVTPAERKFARQSGIKICSFSLSPLLCLKVNPL